MKIKINYIMVLMLGLVFLTGCEKTTKNSDDIESTVETSQIEDTTAREEKVSVEENGVYHLTGEELESENKIDNGVLEKDVNLVYFWQPQCPPCEQQNQFIEALKEKNSEIGIVGIGIAEDKNSVIDYIQDKKISYTNFYIKPDQIQAISDNIVTTPTIIIVDKNGNELIPMQKGLKFELNNLDNEVEEYLKHLKEQI